jgi:multicomponent Na+:H+ antiporter subunit B
MIVALDVVLLVVLLATAVLALSVSDLLASVALLAGYSLFAALLFAGVSAVDVSLVEAALGAGLTGVLFIAAILATTRRSDPVPDRRRKLAVLPLLVGFIGLMLFASTGLPDRGDPEAPAQLGVSQTYLADSLADTETPNVVTSLLADYRSQDTLGETLVIFTAALAAALVLMRRDPDLPAPVPSPDEGPEEAPAEVVEVPGVSGEEPRGVAEPARRRGPASGDGDGDGGSDGGSGRHGDEPGARP